MISVILFACENLFRGTLRRI